MISTNVAILAMVPVIAYSAKDIRLLKTATDHFEVYTTDGEDSAKAALNHFEASRAYLLHAWHVPDPFDRPIKIVAGLGNATTATPNRIAVAGLKLDLLEPGVRQYAELLLERSSPNLPYWLRLGLSQRYSTLRAEKGRVLLGASPMRDFNAANSFDLDMGILLSLQPCFWADKASHDFYAQGDMDRILSRYSNDYPRAAWMLAHMLMFKREYSAKFGAFTKALTNGEKSAAAFSEVYGQSLDGLRQYLALYMKLTSHVVASIPFTPEPVEVSLRLLPANESASILAEFKTGR